MSFLLDTNVVSEWIKARPNPGMVAWLSAADEDAMYLSVLTLGELRHGIERLPAGERRSRLDAWLGVDVIERFDGRVIGIDALIADEWGRLMARSEKAGRPAQSMDVLIAATASVRGLAVVTRNASHFRGLIDNVLNPWS